MANTHDFKTSLNMGEMGVTIAKAVLRSRYSSIIDYNNDMAMQKRGIDLWVEGLGFIEVKTDSHSSDKFFFELSVQNKPGAVDRCCADYFAMLYFKERVMYLVKRPELQKWLREHWRWMKSDHPDWVKEITSTSQGKEWKAVGVAVPKNEFMKDVNVGVLAWDESDEALSNVEWKGD
jgi:hypothetical protein